MKHSKLALGMLVVALGLLMAAPAWAVVVKAADWQMNETSGPMIDSSVNNNDGSPTDVDQGVQQDGKVTYVFNGSTSRVAVPDDASLDPQGNFIRLAASVKVTDAPMDTDTYDIVRKGYSASAGGHYKMEVFRVSSDPTVGKLHCLFKGTEGKVSIKAQPDIVDGQWHMLACSKTLTYVAAKVDGVSYTKTGSAGSISNSKGVLVGAKSTNPLDDVFYGSMDFVRIDINR